MIIALALTLACITNGQKSQTLMRRQVSSHTGFQNNLAHDAKSTPKWQLLRTGQSPALDCPEDFYGYDAFGDCRTDYIEPPNGVLDRLAAKACCEAYVAAQAAAAAQAAKLAAGTVSVKIKSAENLPDVDPGWGTNHTDAYVKLITGTQAAETNHVEHSANPTWDSSHSFDVISSATDADLLIIQVYDHDERYDFWLDGHDKISDLAIQFRTLPPHQWVQYNENMMTIANADAGKIMFDVMWAPSLHLAPSS